MKHRRRYNIQTSKKRNSRTQYNSPYDTSSKGTSKFWRYFFILFFLGAGIYYLMDNIPKSEEPESETVEQTVEQTEPIDDNESMQEETQQAFPIEEKDVKTQEIVRSIQLEVLNGCGTQGVAKIFSRKLKKYQYDIVNSGNYLKNGKSYWKISKTRIIDNTGSLENAEKLADIIGVQYKYVKSKVVQSPIADITIIVGKDYRNLKIIKKR